MTMQNVFITTKIPDAGITLLKEQGYQIEIGDIAKAKGAHALLSQLKDQIDGKMMDAIGSQLKVIANYAVGYNNIDLKAAAERNIIVTNTPGVLTEAVAEHTVGLILALTKRIVEADRFTRAGKYQGFDPDLLVGTEIHGKMLGIVGHGRIGCRVGEVLQKAFGMKVLYYDVKRDTEAELKCGIIYASLDELLSKADVVSIHVPLLSSTHHLISEKELQQMKPTSFLINSSRGSIVDEQALVKALQAKHIQGAALDVFEEEPKITSGLTELENVVLTPHIASATKEAREAMAVLASQSIIAVLSGKAPLNPVSS